MRTLNRPMFNMGGPIKQGIMNGIREPHASGGRAALVGNPVYPQTGGREHHNVAKTIFGAGAGILGGAGKVFGKPKSWWNKIKPTFYTRPGKVIGGADDAAKAKYLKMTHAPTKYRDIAKAWVKENPYWTGIGAPVAVTSGAVPAAAGGAWDAIKAAGLQVADLAVSDDWWDQDKYFADKKKAAEELAKNLEMGKVSAVQKVLEDTSTDESRANFAKSQRDQRVQKYMDLMGYDRSKKTAIADALIDASKIVSDRGTLDTKNITGELINPAIQALSKRLDKPEQIREAVGLMMTKAGLEKEMYEAKSKLTDELTQKRILTEDAKLAGDSLEGDLKMIAKQEGSFPTGENLATWARLRDVQIDGIVSAKDIAKWKKENEGKTDVDYITEAAKLKETTPGTYVVNDNIFIVNEDKTITRRI